MIIIGIDPGLDGAIARVNGADAAAAPIPTLKTGKGNRRIIDLKLRGYLLPANHVVIEQQHAFPKQGGVSNFTIGYIFGGIVGVVTALGLPYSLVRPKTWQRHFGITGSGNTKEQSIIKAQALFPGVDLRRTPRCRKPHDGMADALLIAEWARRQLTGQTMKEGGS